MSKKEVLEEKVEIYVAHGCDARKEYKSKYSTYTRNGQGKTDWKGFEKVKEIAHWCFTQYPDADLFVNLDANDFNTFWELYNKLKHPESMH